MDIRIVVVADDEARRSALLEAVATTGWPTIAYEATDPLVDASAVIVDLAGCDGEAAERTVHLVSSMGPVLAVADRADLASLEAALHAGADDLAVGLDPSELAIRLRRLVRSGPERARAQAGLLPSPAPERTRILVVEDDPDARSLLCDLLDEAHLTCSAPNAEEAIALARRDVPDAILMDLFLPGMSGFDALCELQADPRTSSIPVLFLSAKADDRTRVHGLELGAVDFVVKPYSGPELLARVDKALRAFRQGKHLRAMAETDALTGLPNFRALLARLEEECKRADRYHHPLSTMMVDMDNLKALNDRLGHAAGNLAIVAMGQAILEQLRESDFAARYGGDEFVLLLPHATADQARRLAERLRRSMRKIRIDEAHTSISGSFGVASFDRVARSTPDELLRAADGALYRAKRSGRDRVCVAGVEGQDAPGREAAQRP